MIGWRQITAERLWLIFNITLFFFPLMYLKTKSIRLHTSFSPLCALLHMYTPGLIVNLIYWLSLTCWFLMKYSYIAISNPYMYMSKYDIASWTFPTRKEGKSPRTEDPKPQRVSVVVANFISCNRLNSSKVHLIHLAGLLQTFAEELECRDVVLKPCFWLQSAHMKQIPKQSCV